MSELDTLPEQFKRLLDGISGQYTLEEWRNAYRKVIYSGALKIFEVHPEVIIGPFPSPPQVLEQRAPIHGDPILEADAGRGGQPPPVFIHSTRPPYRPSAIILQWACMGLGECPPPT